MTKALLLASLFGTIVVAGCGSAPSTTGENGLLEFENVAAGVDMPPDLQLGSANEICVWRNLYQGDLADKDPSFPLDGYTIVSSDPTVATFVVAGPTGTSEAACLTATAHAEGTTTLTIETAAGVEVDAIDIAVSTAPVRG